jgi:AcrR family transcriptional regulator
MKPLARDNAKAAPTARKSSAAKSRNKQIAVNTPSRTNDPERTMADIMAVATIEFSEKGLSGARMDAIAAATKTSKRMIYYYFGSKEGLYLKVLEAWYQKVRSIEAGLHLEDVPPVDALRQLISTTLANHQNNPGFVRMVMNENIHNAQYLALSKTAQSVNRPAIDTIRALYERGVAQGVFRPGMDPLDLHMSISALSFFNVSNQATLSLIFKRDLGSKKNLEKRHAHIIDLVLQSIKA